MENKNTTGRTLYIIGNGFDLAHDIKSSYKNYKEYYLSRKDVEKGFDIEMIFRKAEGDWSNIEEAIGEYDADELRETIEPDEDAEEDDFTKQDELKSSCLQHFFRNTINALRTLFKEWVDRIDIRVKSKDKQYKFNNDDLFITFNYTEVLETIYGIPKSNICYIHGRRRVDEEYIFGHNNEQPTITIPKEQDYIGYIDIKKEVIDTMNDFVKPYEKCLKTLNHYIKSAKIEKVIVHGHSLGSVDMVYLEKIVEIIGPHIPWQIDYYNEDEIDKIYKIKGELVLKNVRVRCVDDKNEEYLKIENIEDVY